MKEFKSEDRELKRIRMIEDMFRKKEKEDERKRRLRETREMRKTLLIDVGGA
mgnify:CR=1 FL=1